MQAAVCHAATLGPLVFLLWMRDGFLFRLFFSSDFEMLCSLIDNRCCFSFVETKHACSKEGSDEAGKDCLLHPGLGLRRWGAQDRGETEERVGEENRRETTNTLRTMTLVRMSHDSSGTSISTYSHSIASSFWCLSLSALFAPILAPLAFIRPPLSSLKRTRIFHWCNSSFISRRKKPMLEREKMRFVEAPCNL